MGKRLEGYLHRNIPITKAMGIEVEHATLQKVVLYVPLVNNINHKSTAFGGSLYSAATLACWSLLHVNLKEIGEEHAQIVINHSDASYLHPVDSDFRVESVLPDHTSWQRFVKTLKSKGKARIHLSAVIHHNGRLCVGYKGAFVAITVYCDRHEKLIFP